MSMHFASAGLEHTPSENLANFRRVASHQETDPYSGHHGYPSSTPEYHSEEKTKNELAKLPFDKLIGQYYARTQNHALAVGNGVVQRLSKSELRDRIVYKIKDLRPPEHRAVTVSVIVSASNTEFNARKLVSDLSTDPAEVGHRTALAALKIRAQEIRKLVLEAVREGDRLHAV